MYALLFGAIHGLPVYLSAKWFRSAGVVNAVALGMLFLGLLTGNIAYIFLDLIGVSVGYYFAVRHLNATHDYSKFSQSASAAESLMTSPSEDFGKNINSQNLGNIFESVSYRSRSSTKMWQIFQNNGTFSRLAFVNFEKCLQANGISLSEEILEHAKVYSEIFPQVTVGEYISEQLKPYLARK